MLTINTSIYTLTSPLHDEQAVEQATNKFLSALNTDLRFCGSDFSTYGETALSLIYVRTGGTEGLFRDLLPQLCRQTTQPFCLLTSGESNSLAASMEILSYLQNMGLQGEILHGQPETITRRMAMLAQVQQAKRWLSGKRLGIIGNPSDWLIASQPDANATLERLGVTLVDIPMQSLVEEINALPLNDSALHADNPVVESALPGAERIYQALLKLTLRHMLDGFTLRCFDLLSAVHNTGCLALARMNSEGYVAGCEGDVPALLSMLIGRALTGLSGFQANPSRIDTAEGRIVFAHCTIPLNLVERYTLDTHFESGIGVGIRGFMPCGPVTILKVSADIGRAFIAEGNLEENLSEPNLCRTQQQIRLCNSRDAQYFLTRPIGNHHIILPGHHAEALHLLLNL